MTAEEIDRLTIAEVRAIVERASAALDQLRQLGLLPMGSAVPSMAVRNGGGALAHAVATPSMVAAAEPYPCAGCGRTGPGAPGEKSQDEECLHCGNHLPLTRATPGVVLTNKGPAMITAAERAAAMRQPAFDSSGEPL